MIKIYKLNEIGRDDLERIKKRSQINIEQVKLNVAGIIEKVRKEGDKALVEYTKMWDDKNFDISKLKVNEADIKRAYRNTDKKTIEMIREQIKLSRKFHKKQKEHITNWQEDIEPGIMAGEKWVPIEEVGLYVPGGKNSFPTVQQILAVAAVAAGCKRVVSCISAKGNNYEVIIAANECGVKEVYRVSGAQAIAAMAYGTETVKPVQLIAGPGNPYVTAAKILCQEKVAIDMPAGPSEAVILADSEIPAGLDMQKKAAYCAADILARAEHGPDSAAVLATDSKELAELTKKEIERQFSNLKRKEYINAALKGYCAIIIAKNMEQAIAFTNDYAPEHLEILTEKPEETLKLINNAGSVFLGYYNPVAVGDYASGVNHILPTGGWAKRTSAVGVWTFMKRVQFSKLDKNGLKRLKPIVDIIADVEGLDAHRKSVDMRVK